MGKWRRRLIRKAGSSVCVVDFSSNYHRDSVTTTKMALRQYTIYPRNPGRRLKPMRDPRHVARLDLVWPRQTHDDTYFFPPCRPRE